MTEDLAKSINPEIDYSSLLSDLKQIGYPHKDEIAPSNKSKSFLGKLFDRR